MGKTGSGKTCFEEGRRKEEERGWRGPEGLIKPNGTDGGRTGLQLLYTAKPRVREPSGGGKELGS